MKKYLKKKNNFNKILIKIKSLFKIKKSRLYKILFYKCRDKKVDEIIDYVHQNLQEAGKALATLGENFEHDSKVEPCTQVKPS